MTTTTTTARVGSNTAKIIRMLTKRAHTRAAIIKATGGRTSHSAKTLNEIARRHDFTLIPGETADGYVTYAFRARAARKTARTA